MEELSFEAQTAWLIISTCIIVVISIGAIAIIAWWFISNFTEYRNHVKEDVNEDLILLKHSCATYAAAADAGWSQYIDMKDKCNTAEEDFRDYKSRVEQWDKNKSERIAQLERQLTDNGIEPIPWTVGDVA